MSVIRLSSSCINSSKFNPPTQEGRAHNRISSFGALCESYSSVQRIDRDCAKSFRSPSVFFAPNCTNHGKNQLGQSITSLCEVPFVDIAFGRAVSTLTCRLTTSEASKGVLQFWKYLSETRGESRVTEKFVQSHGLALSLVYSSRPYWVPVYNFETAGMVPRNISRNHTARYGTSAEQQQRTTVTSSLEFSALAERK